MDALEYEHALLMIICSKINEKLDRDNQKEPPFDSKILNITFSDQATSQHMELTNLSPLKSLYNRFLSIFRIIETHQSNKKHQIALQSVSLAPINSNLISECSTHKHQLENCKNSSHFGISNLSKLPSTTWSQALDVAFYGQSSSTYKSRFTPVNHGAKTDSQMAIYKYKNSTINQKIDSFWHGERNTASSVHQNAQNCDTKQPIAMTSSNVDEHNSCMPVKFEIRAPDTGITILNTVGTNLINVTNQFRNTVDINVLKNEPDVVKIKIDQEFPIIYESAFREIDTWSEIFDLTWNGERSRTFKSRHPKIEDHELEPELEAIYEYDDLSFHQKKDLFLHGQSSKTYSCLLQKKFRDDRIFRANNPVLSESLAFVRKSHDNYGLGKIEKWNPEAQVINLPRRTVHFSDCLNTEISFEYFEEEMLDPEVLESDIEIKGLLDVAPPIDTAACVISLIEKGNISIAEELIPADTRGVVEQTDFEIQARLKKTKSIYESCVPVSIDLFLFGETSVSYQKQMLKELADQCVDAYLRIHFKKVMAQITCYSKIGAKQDPKSGDPAIEDKISDEQSLSEYKPHINILKEFVNAFIALPGVAFEKLESIYLKRFETLAIVIWCLLPVISLLLVAITCYCSFHLMTLYCLLVIFDKSSVKGGRPLMWVKQLRVWKLMRDYFPVALVKTSELDVGNDKKYLFCYHP